MKNSNTDYWNYFWSQKQDLHQKISQLLPQIHL